MKTKVLDILKQNKTYVSGQELADRLGVSRTAVWKAVAALKKQGYNIVSAGNRGYMLDPLDDVLNAREIKTELPFVFEEKMTSTNDVAKKLALDKCAEFTFVTCNQQTAGKGRLGRTWISPENQNIYLSMVFYPDTDIEQVPQITLVVGLALAKTLMETTGAQVGIKWPNDVLINNKKVVGILTEMQAEIDRILFVVTGIGVNVNQTEFAPEIRDKATSLRLECDKVFKRSEIISLMTKNIKKYYEIFAKGGFKAVRDEYKALCLNLGKTVKATCRGREAEGLAVDISANGELVIQTKDGLVNISSGEASVRTSDNKYI
ncbi:MAG: biotin--[Firmicutes bacterium]|nr:biotin--[acetyl-CoA-carboxylase] ligase [Bacillota bacterium]